MSMLPSHIVTEYKDTFGIQPLIFGISSVYLESVTNLNLAGGGVAEAMSPVPDNTVRCVTNLSVTYVGTSPANAHFRIVRGGNVYVVAPIASPVSGRGYSWSVNLFMASGDYLEFYMSVATAGNDVYLIACGYEMKVNIK